jgi:hypothetical protein
MENAHALVAGIANYQAINPLPPTVLKDAQDIHDTLVNPNYCGYFPNNVQLLLDQEATGDAFRQALSDLDNRSDKDSNVFFYLSSHGGQVESGPHAGEYILPIDVDYTSDEMVAQTAISGQEFTEALRAIPARKVTIVFDCCHSGGIGQPKAVTAPAMKGGLSDSYYEKLKEGRGRAILASSRSTEYSWLLPGAENSLFTTHLLAGLRGGIASEDGLIRIFDVFEYVQPKVTVDQPNQHPIFKAEIEESFPIALYLGGQKGVVPKVDEERGFRYDVYVSYAENSLRDADWVWDTLVPYLEDVGLSVAVSDDVRDPGVSRVVGTERGIEQAKRTLLVLSPDYLADQWGQFENTVTQMMSVEENRARMLALIARPIDQSGLSMRLKMVNPVDLTERGGRAPSDLTRVSGRAKRYFGRLTRELQSPLSELLDTVEQTRPSHDYDVFIAHSLDDEEWICNQLVPKLLSYDLRVLLLEDVAYPGLDRVMTAQEGLSKATRTVVAISPTYMAEDWPDLTEQMTQVPGFQASTRLVPLQVAPTEQGQLAALGELRVIDASDPDPRKTRRNLARLVWPLQQPL